MAVGAAIAGVVVSGASAISQKNQSKKAIKSQETQADAAMQYQKDAAAQARADLNRLFPAAQQSAQQGFQGAADIFGQFVPQQSDIYQQGNINAQNAILAGLPQMQNALMGGNVDLSGLQASQQFQPNFDFLNQQIAQPQVNPTGAPTNADMGVGMVLPPNSPFTGPVQSSQGGFGGFGGNSSGGIGAFLGGSGGFNRNFPIVRR